MESGPELIIRTDIPLEPPLKLFYDACCSGALEVVQKHLDDGIDPNEKYEDQYEESGILFTRVCLFREFYP